MNETTTAKDYSTFTVNLDGDEAKEVVWRAIVDGHEIVGKPWKVEKQAKRIGNVLASAIIYAIGLVIGGTLGIVAGWVIWG